MQQRPIKFRAWSPKYKRLARVEHIDMNIDLGPKAHYVSVEFQPGTEFIWNLSDGTILEQFTGLLDKNGREIYEGDILLNNDLRWVVVWAEAGFYIHEVGQTFKFIFLNEASHSEVIGNIHENPDLIESGAKQQEA